MRQLLSTTCVLFASTLAVADPPKPAHKGPPIDLVATPPFVPVIPPYPGFRPPLWGGYWYGFYFAPYTPNLFSQQPVVQMPQSVPVAPKDHARLAADADRAAAFAPAFLTIELPAVADVWLDGEKQPTSTETTRLLRSPQLTLGAVYTFRVRARWVENGTKYEATPACTVRAGERGKLTVYAGTVVK